MRPDETATSDVGVHRWSEIDQQMMRRALILAARGVGQVSPSPLVGCVITDARGEVVGEGFYLYENLKHAETLALEEAGSKANGATAYVSLEPHAHHGRTPPCTDALIRAGVARVVAPIEDPNPKVSGQGFNHLRAAGLIVETGLSAQEAARLNEKYIHFMRRARPFVHLKLACSMDGRIATRTGDSRWITGTKARERVHHLRHEYDAILIGSGTAINDDPLLTDRSGEPRRLPLVRVVLDPRLRLSAASQLALSARDAPVILFTSERADASAVEALKERGVEVFSASNGGRDLENVLKELGRRSIQSVLVEGGASVAGAFLSSGLVDKVSFFIAPLIIGGCDAPVAVGGTGAEKISDAVRLRDVEITQHGPDLEITGYPEKGMRAEG
ncbi:MAG TPA: bifunctional diaminohydroxyphosphoribosylaminopyrimidine deaminase/5-amino-6-(5-phosphoribosylamino)uracil reductase RibD [Pyrinomonadaceae bacterium]|nr:bifunctional diaminohydroxyphosphoribosylaminopyrimidine deaminase/5-amino-6-(5-phosphoribosylamino)uracil reductase RibD [Pyrinomonadaceae bacterium]